MSAELHRVMVCSPQAAGWGDEDCVSQWRDLGYVRRPDLDAAESQHRKLIQVLESAGADVVPLPAGEGLSLDAVYAHDASLVTDYGAICLRMGKPGRAAEPACHARLYESLGIPVLGEIVPPGTAESGDMVWLDRTTLLVGRSYRTNEEGIRQIGELLAPKGIEVVTAHLPHGNGPESCLHLMSLISILEEKVALVDLAWLSVPTVELLAARGFRWIDIDPSERTSMACNVLALGRRRVVALEENAKTIARIKFRDFDVETFPGSEICQNGSGGPTCLTRPLLRG
jgi:N-dimethylarginine dimethylaminohydrolase